MSSVIESIHRTTERPSIRKGAESHSDRVAATWSDSGRKRVNSCRAMTNPSPPLLPFPHKITMRCRDKTGHLAVERIRRPDDRHSPSGWLRNPEFDRPAVHLAHLAGRKNFHLLSRRCSNRRNSSAPPIAIRKSPPAISVCVGIENHLTVRLRIARTITPTSFRSANLP